MEERLFPEEVMAYSSEEHYFRFRSMGVVAYRLIIVLLIAVLLALPMIHVDISYASRGILQTAERPHSIVSPVSGTVTRNLLFRNIQLKQGDTLMQVDDHALVSEITDIGSAIGIKQDQLADLDILLSGGTGTRTPRYRQERDDYLHRLAHAEKELEYLEDEYRSVIPLYEQGFIARLEFEKTRNRFLTAKESLSILRSEYRTKWEGQKLALRLELLQLNSRLSKLKSVQQQHVITAPGDGILADYTEIIEGSFITPERLVGRIIPDERLVAECLVPPERISGIHKHQRIRLRIDAFPSSVWGIAEARVGLIPSDITIVSGQPFYAITCEIEEGCEFMQQPAVELKSGMTVTGMFLLERKSVYQLLKEKSSKLIYSKKHHEEVYAHQAGPAA